MNKRASERSTATYTQMGASYRQTDSDSYIGRMCSPHTPRDQIDTTVSKRIETDHLDERQVMYIRYAQLTLLSHWLTSMSFEASNCATTSLWPLSLALISAVRPSYHIISHHITSYHIIYCQCIIGRERQGQGHYVKWETRTRAHNDKSAERRCIDDM